MARQLAGTIQYPDGTGRQGTFIFTALTSSSGVIRTSASEIDTAADGSYTFSLEDGRYKAEFRDATGEVDILGIVDVAPGASIGILDLVESTNYFEEEQLPIDFKVIDAAAHTLSYDDSGKLLVFTSATAVTLTLPGDGSIGKGFQCGLWQYGAGQVSLSPAGSATIKNSSGGASLGGQNAYAWVSVYKPNSPAEYFLAGRTK